MNKTYRGSRKHILDWTERPTFVVELLQLARIESVRVFSHSIWMPRGHAEPDEARLETFGPGCLPNVVCWTSLRDWWLVHHHLANTPNWDLAVFCEIENKPGFILVEAKANAAELKSEGKLLEEKPSLHSRVNHDRIGLAIDEACQGLRHFDSQVRISRDSHYQLANRLAFTWKLASLGVPAILIYLGFLGDSGITDVGSPFADDEQWRKTFAAHAGPVIPMDLFERRLDCGSGPAWFLLRSRTVITPSNVSG